MAKAHDDYSAGQHVQAAAHHYGGMRAAQGAGDSHAAQKHLAMYTLHLKALGLDPNGPVPKAVLATYQEQHEADFKPHRGDAMVLGSKLS